MIRRAWFRWARREEYRGEKPCGKLPRVADLEIRARRLAEGAFAGRVSSVFRGRGVEADGVRAYEPGDEIRAVDWNVTARKGSLHVKEFVDDREMEIVLVVDRSGSLQDLASPRPAHAVTEVAATLALVAAAGDHPVGLVRIDAATPTRIRPSRGRNHVRRLLSALMEDAPGGLVDPFPALRGLNRTLGSRALVIVLSDFRWPFQDTGASGTVVSALTALTRSHDVIPIWFREPSPADLPAAGVLEVSDPESGDRRLVDLTDPTVRAALAEWENDHRASVESVFLRLGLLPLDVDPWQDPGPRLRRYFGTPRRVV